jgi:hypothetical protein
MSSKYNQLYGNPALNRALGNIAKTLVGSATDDAAIARANYIDSQTQGQDLKNKNMTDLRASIAPATNVLSNNILRANTGNPNAQFNQSGIPFVDGGNMSMPVSGNPNILPPASMTKENYQGTARAMLGDLTYSPNQFAKAIENLGGAETAKLAQNLISGGNADQMRRGAILNNMNPGLYFDKDTAQTKIKNDFDAKNFKTTTDAGVNEKVGMNKNKLDANVKRIVGLDKNQKVDATARYKFDNRDISIAVGKDKQVVVDKATGEKLGIEPQTVDGKEIYVFDGRQTIDKIEVKVGKADVYMSKERADKLGIPVNDQGQYVIKGSGFNDGSSGGGGSGGKKSALKPSDVKAALTNIQTTYEKFPNYSANLPQAVIGNVEKRIFKMIADDLGDGMPRDQAFASNATAVISQGSVQIKSSTLGFGNNLYAPKFFIDYLKKSDADKDKITKFFKSLGYNVDESKDIASFIRDN